MIARKVDDILQARGVKPVLSPNLEVGRSVGGAAFERSSHYARPLDPK
jgi:hypothetical protein